MEINETEAKLILELIACADGFEECEDVEQLEKRIRTEIPAIHKEEERHEEIFKFRQGLISHPEVIAINEEIKRHNDAEPKFIPRPSKITAKWKEGDEKRGVWYREANRLQICRSQIMDRLVIEKFGSS